MGIVFDIKKFSVHDGPGIRTTVFLKGCGLRCWWCHNPESQHPKPELLLRPDMCIQCGACVGECPHKAISANGSGITTNRDACAKCGSCLSSCYADAREIVGKEMTVAEVITAIQLDTAFYDQSGGGVTFSGGEPLMQGDFLLELLQACKTQEIHTTVDTCGHAPTETLDKIRHYTDLFLYDVKLIDAARHREVTGASNELILDNLRMLANNGHNIIVRIPIIPNINDDAYNINQIAELAKSLPGIQRMDVLPYHKIGRDKYNRIGKENPMPETEPPTDEQVDAIVKQIEKTGLTVTIGG
jgi:pyruvate formate lyase activating enzyme